MEGCSDIETFRAPGTAGETVAPLFFVVAKGS